MSESDTMFNERDRRCAAVQPMLSTDPSYDNQNHRWIATNNRDVPSVLETKFPTTIMVFGVVSSEGHIMPPHIFEVGMKVNTKEYLDVLICIKMDLALNNLKRLICRKTQIINQPSFSFFLIYSYRQW